jgi:chemotaxis protein methyltransferase CheR
MNRLELHDSTFKQISDFIYEKSGIYIPQNKKYLVQNRLLKVIEDNNLKGYDELMYLVKYSPNGKETSRLFNAITTNETYFFREPQQFDIFIDNIVSRVLEEKSITKDIRIWSAACSSGEEPYTISMLMKEKRFNVRADILASDISTSVLESARRAEYGSYSVRNVPETYLAKYFKNKDGLYALDSSIKNSIRFRNVNLMDKKKVIEMAAMDVIFCRNVLIYFNDRTKEKAVSHLYDSLRPGGFLIIGSSESLHNVTRAFMPITINRVVVYQKV